MRRGDWLPVPLRQCATIPKGRCRVDFCRGRLCQSRPAPQSAWIICERSIAGRQPKGIQLEMRAGTGQSRQCRVGRYDHAVWPSHGEWKNNGHHQPDLQRHDTLTYRDIAAGFYADVPDLALTCGDLRCSGSHVIFVWTFTGHDTTSGNSLNIRGWEEWEVGEDLKVVSSKGWFDAEVYALQAAGQ
jgi:hypothetical protein